MAEIKLSELNPIVDVPNEALVYVVVDGISYRTTKEKLMAATTTNLQDGQELDLPYVDSNTFTIPDNYLIISVYKDIALNKKARYIRAGNTITIFDTLEAGDVINIRGLVATGEFVPITPPDLNDVTSQGSYTSVTIQSPNAVNANDLVPLGQVEQMISEIPEGSLNADDIIESPTREFVSPSEKSTWNNKQDKSPNDNKYYALKDGGIAEIIPAENTNIANTDLTLTANRTHNLNSKKLKFTNGDFEVPALTLTQTAENSKPNKINTADGLIVKWTNKLGIQRVFAFMSDVLDKTTLVAQSVVSQVTFNGTIVHDPAVVSGIKSALVLNADNEIKQALAVELMADDGSLVKYNTPAELDAIFPTAVSGFELICENISTVNFPNGCIYKKTQSGWKVEKLYLISDV